MNKLAAVLKLTRIEHSLMLIIAVVAAELVAFGLPSPVPFVLGLVTAVFISMGAFAINDYFDIEVDRKNKKMHRPLVRGDLSASDALKVTFACMAIGIVASLFINLSCAFIAVIFAALSLLYAYRLKDLPFMGNASVSLSMAIPFIFGNYVVTQRLSYAVLIIFFLVFLSGLGREIDGTVRDHRGDEQRHAVTLPKVIGLEGSAYLAFFFYLLAILLSLYLFVFIPPFSANLVYAGIIIIADLMLFYSGLIFVRLKEDEYGSVRNISLLGMGLALIAILLSTLIHI